MWDIRLLERFGVMRYPFGTEGGCGSVQLVTTHRCTGPLTNGSGASLLPWDLAPLLAMQ